MENNSNFGRDLGLLHELCVTGRSNGVTSEFYGYLTHHGMHFRKLAILTRHQKILDMVGMEATAIDERHAEKLIEDVGKIVNGCIACNFTSSTILIAEAIWPKRDGRDLYLHYGFGPEAEAEVRTFHCYGDDSYAGIEDWKRAAEIYDKTYEKYIRSSDPMRNGIEEDERIIHFHYRHHVAFVRMLSDRLKDIQISPQEFSEFSASFEWRKNRLFVSSSYEHCGTGYFFEDTFVPVIRQIVRRRAILALLRQL